MAYRKLTRPRTGAGLILTDARRAAGLTTRQAAELIGVEFQTWGKWERGVRHPTVEAAERIKAVFGVDLPPSNRHAHGAVLGRWFWPPEPVPMAAPLFDDDASTGPPRPVARIWKVVCLLCGHATGPFETVPPPTRCGRCNARSTQIEGATDEDISLLLATARGVPDAA